MASFEIDSPATFQVAIEASPSGVLVVEPEGTIVLVNGELLRQFGYTREELVGQSVDLLVPESLAPVHAVHREGFMRAPEARPMGAGRRLHGRRKDGSEILVEIGLNPIQTANGLLVLASILDITEHRQLDAAHTRSLEKQLDFERLVADLSGQFINTSTDLITDAIRTGLRRIGERKSLDRAAFFRIGAAGEPFDRVHWEREGIPAPPLELVLRSLPRIRSGQTVVFSAPEEVPDEYERAAYREAGTRSAVVLPLSVAAHVVGAVSFETVRAERSWPADVLHRFNVLASVFGQVLARQQRDDATAAAAAEARRLRDQLQEENIYLRQEAQERLGPTSVVGNSAALRRVQEQVRQVAATDSTVLLLGETGTGKELFATQIHDLSTRRVRPMVRVNCGAIPATLIESELFGREKGAFTGALSRQVGRFELANHSTIFLDEIGDLPHEVQVKLLRVIEERQIERLGSPRSITVDTRIIAATHRNLEQRITEGAFREDLYYRLNVFPIHVPPLRERIEDIPLLVWRFVEEFSNAFGKRVDSIDDDTLTALRQYAWPGNIRELRNVVERAMIVTTSRRLTIAVPHASSASARRSTRLVDVETEHIRAVLETTAWRIRGTGGAADRLGLKPTTLETRMAKLGVRRPGHS